MPVSADGLAFEMNAQFTIISPKPYLHNARNSRRLTNYLELGSRR